MNADFMASIYDEFERQFDRYERPNKPQKTWWRPLGPMEPCESCATPIVPVADTHGARRWYHIGGIKDREETNLKACLKFHTPTWCAAAKAKRPPIDLADLLAEQALDDLNDEITKRTETGDGT